MICIYYILMYVNLKIDVHLLTKNQMIDDYEED